MVARRRNLPGRVTYERPGSFSNQSRTRRPAGEVPRGEAGYALLGEQGEGGGHAALAQGVGALPDPGHGATVALGGAFHNVVTERRYETMLCWPGD